MASMRCQPVNCANHATRWLVRMRCTTLATRSSRLDSASGRRPYLRTRVAVSMWLHALLCACAYVYVRVCVCVRTHACVGALECGRA